MDTVDARFTPGENAHIVLRDPRALETCVIVCRCVLCGGILHASEICTWRR